MQPLEKKVISNSISIGKLQ